MSQIVADIEPPSHAAPSRQSLLRALVTNPLALTGLIILSAVVLMAVLAPLIALYDPATASLSGINAAPGSPGYPLGGDSSGRDILSRLIWGAQLTLLGALLAIVVAVAIGVPFGLLAGYYGKGFDAVASYIANALFSLPSMVVLLAVIAAFGPSVWITMIAFGVMLAPGLFRLVRAQVMAVRNDLYLDAARVSGLSNARIIARHVLFVVRAPIIIQASVLAGIAIIIQSGLEFLGLGDPSSPTWGGMLGDAFNVIYLAPTALIWPGAAIAVTVASLILLGNGLRDAVQGVSFAPKRRRSKRARPASHRATRVTSREHSPATVMPGGSPHALEVRNLRIGYPQPDGTDRVVVHDVSFTIDRGEVRGLVGESGSGKSQTAFAVLGLLPQGGTVLGGEIILDGVDVLTLPPRERRALLGRAMGYIPQEPMSNLDPAFTIGHQLIWPLMNHGMTKKSATQKILGLLAEVGIPDPPRTFGSYPHQVSGGMAQRVLIAGAIAGDPELLIADEATTALDVTVQAEVLTLLRRLQQSRNMAVLMVTHNFGVVADICDSVAVMRGGRIIESAPAIELFANPQHEYTVSLLAATLEDAEPRPRLGTSTARLTGRNPS